MEEKAFSESAAGVAPVVATRTSHYEKQVVVFASGGVTRSVAVRELAAGAVPCVVVDYDECSTSEEDFERNLLGVVRAEFDKAATYIF